MIISHKYKLIFIKTNKTAGTSFEIALSKLCGDEDIITPIPAEDEELRKKIGGKGPQNFIMDSNIKFYNHVSAAEIKPAVGNNIWSNYYKFCFERNPWDRVISFYYWRIGNNPNISISEFIDSDMINILKMKGYNLYTINNTLAVDKIYLFENIASEIENISKDLGLPECLELPFAKSQHRKDKRHYTEVLSKDEQEKIARLFSEEISMFGY